MRPFTIARTIAGGFAVCLLLMCCCGAAIAGDDNLLSNGELVDGTGYRPSHWDRAITRPSENTTMFSWIHQPGAAGELRLTNVNPNDSEWSQTVRLFAGLYYLSGEMRTEVMRGRLGDARIGIDHHERASFDFPSGRTGRWTRGGMYFRVRNQADVEVFCRLQYRIGTASFRHLKLVPVADLPPQSAMAVDFDRLVGSSRDAQPSAGYERPAGSIWSVLVFMLLLAALTVSGWVGLGRS